MIIDIPKLKEQFESTCILYAQTLCKNYDWNYNDCFWVLDKIGGTFMSSGCEYAFSMDELRLLVEKNVDYKTMNEWWEYNLKVSYAITNHTKQNKFYMVSLERWVEGLPKPFTNEELEEEVKKYWEHF